MFVTLTFDFFFFISYTYGITFFIFLKNWPKLSSQRILRIKRHELLCLVFEL